MNTNQSNAVWGIQIGPEAIRRVRVSTRPDGLAVDRADIASAEGRWNGDGDLSACARQLDTLPPGAPVAGAVPSGDVLMRVLQIPLVDADTRDQLVRRQVETLLPIDAEQLLVRHWVCGQDRQSSQQRLLVIASRRSTLATPQQILRSSGRPVTLVASLVGLASLEHHEYPTMLIDLAPGSTAFAVTRQAEILDAGTCEAGWDEWVERIADHTDGDLASIEADLYAHARGEPIGEAAAEALAEGVTLWARRLREAVDEIDDDAPARPTRALLFGAMARVPGVVEAVSQALEIDADAALCPANLELPDDMDFVEYAGAIGAAVAADAKIAGEMSLIEAAAPEQATPQKRRIAWVWAASILWLVGALAAMYLADRSRAEALQPMVRDARQQAETAGNLPQQLAIGRYLETAGPQPLDMLDEVTAAVPEGTLLTSWTYRRGDNRSGPGGLVDVTLGGTLPNEGAFTGLLQALGKVGAVEWKSGRTEKDSKFRFDVALSIANGLATPPATQPADAKPKSTTAPGAKKKEGGS